MRNIEAAFDDVVALTAERNFGLYEPTEYGSIREAR